MSYADNPYFGKVREATTPSYQKKPKKKPKKTSEQLMRETQDREDLRLREKLRYGQREADAGRAHATRTQGMAILGGMAAKGGLPNEALMRRLGVGAGAPRRVTDAEKTDARRRNTEIVLAESRKRNAAARAARAKDIARRVEEEGFQPTMQFQVGPDTPLYTLKGRQTELARFRPEPGGPGGPSGMPTGEPAPAATARAVSGMHADVAERYGLKEKLAPEAVKGLTAYREAMRDVAGGPTAVAAPPTAPTAPPDTAGMLKAMPPSAYGYAANRAYPEVEAPQVEGPGGTMPAPADKLLQSLQERVDIAFAAPSGKANWSTQYKYGRPENRVKLMEQLEGIIPDPQQRQMYLASVGVGEMPENVGVGTKGPSAYQAGERPGAMMPTTEVGVAARTPEQEQAEYVNRLKADIADARARFEETTKQLAAMPQPTTQPAAGEQPGITDIRSPKEREMEDLDLQEKRLGLKLLGQKLDQGPPVTEGDAAQAAAVAGIAKLRDPSRGFSEGFNEWALDMESLETRTRAALNNITNPRAQRQAALAITAQPEWASYVKYAQQATLPDADIVRRHQPPGRGSPLGTILPGGWIGAQDSEHAPRAVKAIKRMVDAVNAAAATPMKKM